MVTGLPSRASYSRFEVALLHTAGSSLELLLVSSTAVSETDHLTESSFDSVSLEEHMLCTAQTDTFCTQLTSLS